MYSFELLLSVHQQAVSSICLTYACCSMYSLELLLSVHQQAVSSICLTYACFCMYSLELLMMDGNTVRNMYSVTQNEINLRQWCIWLVLL